MKRATATTFLALAATLVAAAGCSAAHPAEEDTEPGAVTTSDTLVGSFASTATSTEASHQVCTPGDTRACKTYWTDTRGQLHCMTLEQVCRADGFRWQPCGDLDAGAAADAQAAEESDAAVYEPSGSR